MSVHYLVKTALKLKLEASTARTRKTVRHRKIDDIVSKCQVQLSSRFQLLQDATDIEEQWTIFKGRQHSSAMQALY